MFIQFHSRLQNSHLNSLLLNDEWVISVVEEISGQKCKNDRNIKKNLQLGYVYGEFCALEIDICYRNLPLQT